MSSSTLGSRIKCQTSSVVAGLVFTHSLTASKSSHHVQVGITFGWLPSRNENSASFDVLAPSIADAIFRAHSSAVILDPSAEEL